MAQNWTKIVTTSNPITAELAKQVLEESGIEAVILNKQDSSYHFGEVQVLVPEADSQAAQKLLSDNPF
ncbi:MAG: DUF2007 domain-containing protein [Sphingobacteriaceae bacterium]